jgi:neutral amino acid transport system ATP-binding protein
MTSVQAPSAAILAVDNAAKSFGGLRAVDGASFAVTAGSITALIGPNGAGKTTIFDLITGYEQPDLGTIRFDGQRIDGVASYRIARLGLIRTFQLTRVFAAMSVLDNMLLGVRMPPGEALSRLMFKPAEVRRAETEAHGRAFDLLRRFGLAANAYDYAGILSGGQRKLLEFARALMSEPRLMLLDEPMAGVNRSLGARLLDEVEEFRRGGMTFLFVEHDLDIVMRRADRIIVMAEGKVIAAGSPAVIRADARVVDAYLGSPRAAAP